VSLDGGSYYGGSFESWSAVIVPASVEILFGADNYILNPSFDASLGLWAADAGVASFDNPGLSAQVTLGGMGTPGEIITDYFVDTAPGAELYASAFAVSASAPGTELVLRLDWYSDGDDFLVSNDILLVYIEPGRLESTFTAPSVPTSAFKVKLALSAVNPTADDVVVVWDDVMLTAAHGGQSVPYFDGSYPAGGGYLYQWNGTPHESTSTRFIWPPA
jgi:hypothetical protein